MQNHTQAEENILQVLLGELYDKLANLKNLVVRDATLPEADNKIKVIIGMRRAGKTYFLYQHILKLLEAGVDRKRILYINFEDDRLVPLSQQKMAKLVDAFYALYPENHEQKCYLFFDEIHTIEDWQLVIRRLHNSKNAEFFLTGSSAKLFSKEIATNLRGRSLATEIWPYSFHEFLRAKKVSFDLTLFDKKTEDWLRSLFLEYLTVGGFPEVTSYDAPTRHVTLQEYLNVALYRDIVERHEIKNHAAIKYMIVSMVHNAGKSFSINKFYNDLKSQGFHIGKDVLYDYASYIEDAYLAFAVPLFDKSIRKVQTNPKKVYAIDPGLARAMTLDYESDLGRLFENVVYLDLRRLGCTVHYYLSEDRYEVDFVAETARGKKKLFQVVWEQQDIKTFEREQRGLDAGMQALGIEGVVLTLDEYLRRGVVI